MQVGAHPVGKKKEQNKNNNNNNKTLDKQKAILNSVMKSRVSWDLIYAHKFGARLPVFVRYLLRELSCVRYR